MYKPFFFLFEAMTWLRVKHRGHTKYSNNNAITG